jgi:hypothetical protein
MSIVLAEPGPTEPEPVDADAPVKVTVPKLESGTRELPSSKSSTIHSASCWQSADEEVIDLETDWPFELFLITAVPDVVDLAVTVRVTESPALNEMPEKS